MRTCDHFSATNSLTLGKPFCIPGPQLSPLMTEWVLCRNAFPILPELVLVPGSGIYSLPSEATVS